MEPTRAPARCDTLIFGASFLGIGAALAANNCIVAESGGIFGAEFVNTYKVTGNTPIAPKTGLGRTFLAELKNRKLASEDGCIYQAPAVYVMSKFLKEKPVDIRFMTELIKIEKNNGLFKVTVYHAKGFETITAGRLIDTTTLGRGHKKILSVNLKKSLNAVIHNPLGNSIENLYHNELSGLFIYSLEVPINASRYEAAEKLLSMENVFKKNEMKITSIAPEFSYAMPAIGELRSMEKIEENFSWHPSAGYANLAAAFDEGVSIGSAFK